MQIEYTDNLPSEMTLSAISLYMSALADKIDPVLGTNQNTQDFLAQHIAPNRCLAAIHENQVVGILGLQTNTDGFLNIGMSEIIKQYGIIRGLLKTLGLGILQHQPQKDEWYIDGIAVAESMRGKGIGSELLAQLEAKAKEQKIKKLSLQVTNTNPKAKALYSRLGFKEHSQNSLFPFTLIYKFPFSSATSMLKTLG